jgi:flagellar basal body-associated protein FliL
MAEEVEEVSESGGGDGGGVLKKYGPLAFIVLIAQVVLAWGIIQFGGLSGQVAEENNEEQLDTDYQVNVVQDEEDEALPYYLGPPELAKIAINPAGTNADRIAQFGIILGLVAANTEEDKPEDRNITSQLGEKAEIMDKITPYMSKVKAIVLEVLSSKTMDELEPELRPLVLEEIKDRINQEVFRHVFKITDNNKIEVKVQEVRFTDLIMM